MRHQTSFMISPDLKTAMRTHMKEEGYGFKQQSLWLEEAVVKLLEDDPYLETLRADSNLSERISMTAGERFQEAMEKAVTYVRQQDPMLERVRGLVIRAAIRNRLAGADVDSPHKRRKSRKSPKKKKKSA